MMSHIIIIQIVNISSKDKSRDCLSRFEEFSWDFSRKDFKSIFNPHQNYNEYVTLLVSKDTNKLYPRYNFNSINLIPTYTLVVHIQMWASKCIENKSTTVD